MTVGSKSTTTVVCIRYDELVSVCCRQPAGGSSTKSIDDLIEKAFGNSSSLGIIAITDVPKLPSLRLRLLPLAQKLASLLPEQLDEITDAESGYQVGWSHGREKLEGDKLDFSKGSFYANPLTESLAEIMLERRRQRNIGDSTVKEFLEWDESLESIKTDEEVIKLAKKNPAFFAPNVWPSDYLPELEPAFREAGQLVHQVGVMVAQCCDSYVSARCSGYVPKLETILRNSKCCKARLLHYFATEDDASGDNSKNVIEDTHFSNWCGWHNDHGSLTGLVPALYLDNTGKIVNCPDPKAGLYCKSRNGELVQAKIPADALAFQVGETMQIHTGGWLQATPHAVRGCKGGNVSRETFAVFMEPEYHSSMNLPPSRTLEDTQCIDAEKSLPSNVRTISKRWKLGMTFGEFSDATFAAFY
mmetsp:Transcript_4737/g.10175  ORF Transcript_4737/g.10175 Transcript_4737/m.10175 type:complete len:416 (-) Transcript_4737:140-1387(-)|eukprot:CAMPEP_0172527628 /NCGR_PEP_ID=MMETSP1067-20121228/2275_1 /TAXON_ID=265564 ORGANISM="Thalassiosira punctigera, Strain Tpunct2005C2" /NCGR_SAMPLE_ID=MMETSP1067 /ASSEMBLY_ACC=CAM_ASM_000444 /LENGTH=415 /DNA_ID=CAMNT_0013311413 /DNA_START=79 /DNA_END=1326 /DNA_ORIENTATION=+